MASFISRRRFLSRSGILAGGGTLGLLSACGGGAGPAVIASDSERPKLLSGLQFGDVTADKAIIWSRSDRVAQMIVEYDTSERFSNASRIVGPYASAGSDFTTRVDLNGLPPGQSVFVRVRYVDPDNGRIESETLAGQFRTTPALDGKRAVRFHWSGDNAGQGWGINPDFGGVKISARRWRRAGCERKRLPRIGWCHFMYFNDTE